MKKLTRKEKITLQHQDPEKKFSVKKELELARAGKSMHRILMLVIVVFAFSVYSNTLNHQYVLDDFGIIPENLLTKKGFSALPEIFSSTYRAGTNLVDNTLYRPLSKAMFAIEWQMAPDTPALSHWINVIFFALTCMLIFSLLSLCLKGNTLVPFIAAMLFAAHPIHTEIVANIKSRDEIMCLLFCLLAARSCILYVQKQHSSYLLLSAVLFFLAFLSKESAITWIAVIPMIMYFFTPASRVQIMKGSVPLIIATIVFLMIRSRIVTAGSPVFLVEDNYLSGIKDFLTREANAIFLLGVYLKQLIFPVTLISDASYNHFKEVKLTDFYFLLSLVVHLALLVYAILRFKQRDIFAFCILYYFITLSLVSNVLFLIGTNYGERLLYIPSLAFCLAIATLIHKLFAVKENSGTEHSLKILIKQHKPAMTFLFVLLVLYSTATVARNKDWHDNMSLYSTDILKVPDSAHMQFYYANHITSDDEIAKIKDTLEVRKTYEEGIRHLDKSIEILPRYADAYQRKGFIYHKLKQYDKAAVSYEKSIDINATFPVAQNNYANLLFETGRFEEALKYFKAAFKLNPHYSHAAANIASVHGVYGEAFVRRAKEDPSRESEYLEEARRNFLSSIEYFQTAIRLDPEAVSAYKMLSVTYANLGDKQNADKYSAMAEKIQRAKQ